MRYSSIGCLLIQFGGVCIAIGMPTFYEQISTFLLFNIFALQLFGKKTKS